MLRHQINLRVRYSETDQMGTFYNSRALEWFECARTESLRSAGVAYAELENKGILLPVVEAHLKYLGKARYDDLLSVQTTIQFSGKASVRFDVAIAQAENGAAVVEGYTIHAITDATGKPIRPPQWLSTALSAAQEARL